MYHIQKLTNNHNSKGLLESWHQYFDAMDQDEFTLFHLTTTYLPYQDRKYSTKDINRFFVNFYLKNLLPNLFQSRTWTKSKKLNQPIVLTFPDEHQLESVLVSSSASGDPIYAQPVRLHHHSIIASRQATTEKFLKMCGKNTMLPYSAKMMTSCLDQCDSDTIFYAAKMLWKYPDDYLSFGFRNPIL